MPNENKTAPVQLPLGIRLNDECRFENYHISPANQGLLDELLENTAQKLLYIRSQADQGLSHLLQALCHQQDPQNPALYLPLQEQHNLDPDILQGCGHLGLVCIDDLHTVAGNPAWERALFNAFNEINANDTRLILGARENPSALNLELADLRSRLQLAPVYQLMALDDEDKKQLLQLRARGRGMNLSPAVAGYILARTERGLSALIAVLDKLDAITLAHQRPLTIPLVRESMGW